MPPQNYADIQPDIAYSNQNSDAPQTVTGIDLGASIFVAISPVVPTDLNVSTTSEGALTIVSNQPPVQAAHNAERQTPQVSEAIAPNLARMLTPFVPRKGVPGISFGYSLSGNAALW